MEFTCADIKGAEIREGKRLTICDVSRENVSLRKVAGSFLKNENLLTREQQELRIVLDANDVHYVMFNAETQNPIPT